MHYWRRSLTFFIAFVCQICLLPASSEPILEIHELGQINTQASSACPETLLRPCVALVLGGGGARGGAHIGVLKALEESGIQLDLIVGTSIGSYVGGLYASGKNAAEIEKLFLNADWNSGYKDELSRRDIPNRRKRQLDEFPIHLDLGIGRNGIQLPKGMIQGQSMKTLVGDMLGTFPVLESFDELPIAFRAVAADIETGEEVVLDRGDLATAMQTSMSLPGILRPIEHDGRILVDGGIANNLPVSVARSLGADIVIAVNIGSPPETREELSSGFSILMQLSSFLVIKNEQYQQSLLNNQDLLLTPQMDDVHTLDFDKIKTAIDAGYADAKQKLNSYSYTSSLHRVDTELATYSARTKLEVGSIILNNNSRLADDYILHRMKIEPGHTYTPKQIQKGIDRLYGQGTIARVSSEFEETTDENILYIDVEEKEWGPGYLDFKLSFEDNFNSFSRYQFGVYHRLTNMSPYGAELATEFEFGTEKNFSTDLYWPIGHSGFFWNAIGYYERLVADYAVEAQSYGTIISSDVGGIGGLGWHSTDKFELVAGGIYIDATVELPAILQEQAGFEELDVTRSGANLSFNFDSLDNANFPKRGWKLAGNLTRTRDELLGLEDYSTQIDMELNGVFSRGRHSFRNLIRVQSTLNDDPYSLLGSFSLGGFLNLSGNTKNFISGQHVRLFGLIYNYELVENNFGAIRLPLYLGFSLEAGNAWADEDDIDYGNMINSGSVYVGWSSPLGPAYLAYGASDTGEKSLYVYLGVIF